MICEYYYEGAALISCCECEKVYEIIFQGSTVNVEEVIKSHVKEEGWKNGKCPDCITKGRKV